MYAKGFEVTGRRRDRTMFISELQINKNLKDDLFTLPAKLPILPPAK